MALKFEKGPQKVRPKPVVQGNYAVAASGLVGFLLRRGWAKSKRQANLIMFILLCALLAVMYFTFNQATSTEPDVIVLPPNIDPGTYLPYGITPL